MVHRGVAGGGAQQRAHSGAHRRGCHFGQNGAFPGPRRPLDTEDVARGQGHRSCLGLLGIEGCAGESLGPLEFRWAQAEQQVTQPPAAARLHLGHLGQRCSRPPEGDVIRDDVQHHPPRPEESWRRPVEGHFHPGAGAAHHHRALGSGGLVGPRPGLHHLSRRQPSRKQRATGPLQRHHKAPSKAHRLLHPKKARSGQPARLAFLLAEAGALLQLPCPRGSLLELKQPLQRVEMLQHERGWARG